MSCLAAAGPPLRCLGPVCCQQALCEKDEEDGRLYLLPFGGDFVQGFVELRGHFRKFVGDTSTLLRRKRLS